MVSRRGVWRSLQTIGISSLDCTYHLPLNFSSTKVLKTASSFLWFTFQILRPFSHSLRLVMASNASPSTSYRSCWHVVGPGFSSGVNQYSNPRTDFTTIIVFMIQWIVHPRKTLVQTFVYWPIFSTAANGRVFFSPHVTVHSFKTAKALRFKIIKIWLNVI